MLSSTYAEVLNIISTAQPTKGMTCAEIYKLTSDNLDTQITDPAQVSKICFAVRNNGFIRTFLADKKNHHTITAMGIDALQEYLEAKAISTNEVKVDKHHQINQADRSEDLDAMTRNFEKERGALLIVKQAGYTILDPLIDAHKPMISLIQLLDAASQVDIPVIKNKLEKITTLSRLGNVLSDDINTIFSTIIDDLNQLEESHV